jgi:hypothetical protein
MCLYLFPDAELGDFWGAARRCWSCHPQKREAIELDISQLWTRTSHQSHVLLLFSARTGLDLFLQAMNFPHGSEVIVSAINIPSIVHILHHHSLRPVPIDIDARTLGPKLDQVFDLLSNKTVAFLLAHIYGRWFDIEPFIQVAKMKGLMVIEDCAEAFCGFHRTGHPLSDISLFSFGPIKYCTAFGGAIAKVKSHEIYLRMQNLHSTYPFESSRAYLIKVLKCYLVYLLTTCPSIVKPGIKTARTLKINHKEIVVEMLRGFPKDLIKNIRLQPSGALLSTMLHRFKAYSPSSIQLANAKATYVINHLPKTFEPIALEAAIRNHWLFPIVVVSGLRNCS